MSYFEYLERPDPVERSLWLKSFVPSDVTFLDLKSGRQVQEPSLAALKHIPDLQTPQIADSFLAAGSGALAYQNDPSAIVYSPLRHGQIADYTATQYMFRLFYRQLRPVPLPFKPIMCVHEQMHTTEVEERALIDALIQTGARKVILYLESLPDFLRRAREDSRLKDACVLHIEPRD